MSEKQHQAKTYRAKYRGDMVGVGIVVEEAKSGNPPQGRVTQGQTGAPRQKRFDPSMVGPYDPSADPDYGYVDVPGQR